MHTLDHFPYAPGTVLMIPAHLVPGCWASNDPVWCEECRTQAVQAIQAGGMAIPVPVRETIGSRASVN